MKTFGHEMKFFVGIFCATFGKNVLMLNVIMLIAECQNFAILSVILAPFLMSLPVNLLLQSVK
jgi:hypothetical protein